MAFDDQLTGPIDPTASMTSAGNDIDPGAFPDAPQVDSDFLARRLLRKGAQYQQDVKPKPPAPETPPPDFTSFGVQPNEADTSQPDFTQFGEQPAPPAQPKGVVQSQAEGAWAGAKSVAQSAGNIAGEAIKGLALIPPGTAASVDAPFVPGLDDQLTAPKQPVAERPAYKTGEAIKQWSEQNIPVSPAEKEAHPYWTGIGSAVGGVVAPLAIGVIDPVAGLVAASALFGFSGAANEYDAAKAKGADEATAQSAAALSGAANAALGTLNVGLVLKPFAKFMPQASGLAMRILAQAGQNSVTFGTIGEAQEFIGQWIAKLYDSKAGYDLPFTTKQATERLIGELGAGALLGGIHGALSGRGTQAEPPPPGTPPGGPGGAIPPPGGGAGPAPEAGKPGADAGVGAKQSRGQQWRREWEQTPAPEANESQRRRNVLSTILQSQYGFTAADLANASIGDMQHFSTDADMLQGSGYKPSDIAKMTPTEMGAAVDTVKSDILKRKGGGDFSNPDDVLRKGGMSDEDIAKMSAEDKAKAATEIREAAVETEAPPGTVANPINLQTPADLAHAVAVSDTSSTHEQGAANNAPRVHAAWNGIPITLETAGPNNVRRGTDDNGAPWEQPMGAPSGYIKGTEGADGDHVDVSIGPNPESKQVYVIDEVDRDTGDFRQHKAFIGFRSSMDTTNAYTATGGKDRSMRGGMRVMSVPEFKEWLKNGDTKAPVSDAMKAKAKAKDESILPEEAAAEPHAEHVQAVEGALRAAGVDPVHMRPADIHTAAEIHTEEGAPPADAAVVAVVRNLVRDGHVTAEQVEEAIGHEAATDVLEAQHGPERGARAETPGTTTGGPATEAAGELGKVGADNGAPSPRPENAEPAVGKKPAGDEAGGERGGAVTAGHPENGRPAVEQPAGGERPAASSSGRVGGEPTERAGEQAAAEHKTAEAAASPIDKAVDRLMAAHKEGGHAAANKLFAQMVQKGELPAGTKVGDVADKYFGKFPAGEKERAHAQVKGKEAAPPGLLGEPLKAMPEHTVTAADGSKVRVVPIIIRRSQIKTSSDEGYDQNIQPRQTDRAARQAHTRAMADADHLTTRVLDLIKDGANLGTAENRPFVRAFIAALPATERSALANKEGALSAEGLTRVKNAVLAKAYNDVDVVSRITESTDDDIRSISNGLVIAAPAWAKFRDKIESGNVRRDLDATPNLMDAVKRVADLRARGENLEKFLAQHDAFDQLSEPTLAWMRLFYDPRGKRVVNGASIAEGLTFYAQDAAKVTTEPRLGLDIPEVTSDDLQRRALEKAQGLPSGNGAGNGAHGNAARAQAGGRGIDESGEGSVRPKQRGTRLSDERPDLFSEPGVDGRPQLVIPGTEPIGSAELAKRRAAEPLKPKAAQKATDEGLFAPPDTQVDLEEAIAKAPEKPELPETASNLNKSQFENVSKDLETKGAARVAGIDYKIIESQRGGNFYYTRTEKGIRIEKGGAGPVGGWSREKAVAEALKEIKFDIGSAEPEKVSTAAPSEAPVTDLFGTAASKVAAKPRQDAFPDKVSDVPLETAAAPPQIKAKRNKAPSAPSLFDWEQTDERPRTQSPGAKTLGAVAPEGSSEAEGGGQARPGIAGGGEPGADGNRAPDEQAPLLGGRGEGSGAPEVHPTETGTGRGRPGRGATRGTGGKGTRVPEKPAADVKPQEAPSLPEINYRITDETELGKGSEGVKFRDNVAAIGLDHLSKKTFDELKNRPDLNSTSAISTDVGFGEKPVVLERRGAEQAAPGLGGGRGGSGVARVQGPEGPEGVALHETELRRVNTKWGSSFVMRAPVAPSETFNDLGPYQFNPAQPIGQQAQSYVHSRGVATGLEHILAVNDKGETLLHGSGTARHTGRSVKLTQLLLDPNSNLVIHHNHPSNNGLSVIDFAQLAMPGLKSIWAHGHGGNVTRASITPEGKAVLAKLGAPEQVRDGLIRIGEVIGNSVRAPLQDLINSKVVDIKQAEKLYGFTIGQVLHRSGLIDYSTTDGEKLQDDINNLGLEPYIEKAARIAAGEFFHEPGRATGYGANRPTEPLRHVGDLGATFGRVAPYAGEHRVAPRADIAGRAGNRPQAAPRQLDLAFAEGEGEGEPPEKVISAAVQVDGRTFTGVLHSDAWEAADRADPEGVTYHYPTDEGYITSTGRFVNREEAWDIAKDRNQIESGSEGPELASEHLKPWDDADVDRNNAALVQATATHPDSPHANEYLTVDGKPAWGIVVDNKDHAVLHVVRYEHAADSDFHHNHYMPEKIAKKVSKGTAEFVWGDAQGLQSMEPISADMRQAVAKYYGRAPEPTGFADMGAIFNSPGYKKLSGKIADALASDKATILKEGLSNYSKRMELKEQAVVALYNKWVNPAGELPDEQQFHALKRLFPGKVGDRVQVFNKDHFVPLDKFLRKNGITEVMAGDFAYAQHAEERNLEKGKLYAQAALFGTPQEHQFSRAMRDPNLVGASGMSTAHARAILAKTLGGPKAAAYRELSKRIDGIRNFRTAEMLRTGLEGQDAVSEWARTYKHYVPLKEWDNPAEAPENAVSGRGRGRGGVRGPENKYAFGRRTRADNPVIHLINDAYRTINRGEQNMVSNGAARAFANLQHHGANLAKDLGVHLNRGRPVRKIDPNTGLPTTVDSALDRFGSNAVPFKNKGRPLYMVFDDQRVADAFNRWAPASLWGPLKGVQWSTNKMKSLWTHYSPTFVARHNARYFVEGLENSYELKETGAHSAITYIKQGFPMIGEATRAIFAREAGKPAGEIGQSYDILKKQGAFMAMRMMRDIDQLKDDLRIRLNDMGRAKRNPIKIWHGAVQAMNNVSSVWDNAQRLTMGHMALKQGKTPQQAAIIARDATIDYQLRGLWSNYMGIWQPFFNTALRTGFRMGGAVSRSKIMRRVFFATVAMGLGAAIWNYLVGGKDPADGKYFFDKIPPWEKSKGFILLNPWNTDEKGRPMAIKWPFPYNWSFPLSAGYGIGNMFFGDATVGSVLKDMFLKPFLSTFSQIGEEGLGIRSVMPELLRPEYDVARNTNWKDRPVHQDEAYQNKPNSWSGFKDKGDYVRTGEGWKEIAQFLNGVSGGSRVKSGYFDFYPEDIREVFNPFVGTQLGFGNQIIKTVKSIAGGGLPASAEVPIGHLFYGQDYDASDIAAAAKRRQQVRQPWTR